jgi:hypothetical protein
MYPQDMEARMQALEKQVTKLNDIESLQRLQKSYGYYLQHWMYQEICDLFADSPEAELNLMTGIFSGKNSIKNYFYSIKDQHDNPEFLHQLMQLSGIVDINPDGVTAKGRWFAYGALSFARDEGVLALYADGIYASDYVKINGVWNILKLVWNPLVVFPPSGSWVKKERALPGGQIPISGRTAKPDKPREIDSRYTSGYIVPFHFPHPVTGRKTDVEAHNAAMKKKK